MPGREFRPNEVSAGGVVVRTLASGHQACLVNDGHYWGLPKGNVDRGETPEQAALREIEEEIGIPAQRLRVIATLPASEYVYRRGGRLIFKRVYHFLVQAPARARLTPQPEEIAEAVWLPFDKAIERASFRDAVVALHAAREELMRAREGAAAAAP